MGPYTLTYDPMYDMRNRFTRRRAMKLTKKVDNLKGGWQELKHMFKPKTTPTVLGINKYKKLHSDEPKRVLYYKKEMWNAFHELKGEDMKEKNEKKDTPKQKKLDKKLGEKAAEKFENKTKKPMKKAKK